MLMVKFQRPILFLLLLIASLVSHSQLSVIVDSLKSALENTTTSEEKVELLDNLSRTLMSVDLKEGEKYGKELIFVAEESRDRELMVKAYISNGIRCSYWAGAGNISFANQSISYYKKALEIAKESRFEKYVVSALIQLAAVHLLILENDNAMDYANQASSAVSILDNDSLQSRVFLIQGDAHLAKNSKIQALRFYLSSLRLAERLKSALLLRESYLKLSNFYAGIGDHDRAIDYYVMAFNKLEETKAKNAPYQKVVDINSIGNLYAAKKNYDISIHYHEKSIRMADSLNFPNLKIPAYLSLLNEYLEGNKPQKALEYFNSTSGKNLQDFLSKFRMSGIIDQAYGVIYTNLNQLDSAGYYLNKAAPFFDKNNNQTQKINFDFQQARYYNKNGENDKAIDLLLQVKEAAIHIGLLDLTEKVAKELDTLYTKKKDFKLASQYNSMYHIYKDSIQQLNKEKELAQVEAQDEQDRIERIQQEEAEAKRRRNNIQYLAITIGIVVLFIALVVLGMFKVSATTIKMIGFFAFLMFFEFIFLIFKKNIYSITKGEPWKDLLFMIGLAAVLLPLHHWLEHKVIKYLTSHNRLTAAGYHIRSKIFGRTKNKEQ